MATMKRKDTPRKPRTRALSSKVAKSPVQNQEWEDLDVGECSKQLLASQSQKGFKVNKSVPSKLTVREWSALQSKLVKSSVPARKFNDLKIHTWNVNFSGEGENFFTFVNRLKDIKKSRELSDDDILKALPEILKGKALQWFRTIEPGKSLADVFQEMKDVFVPANHERLLREEIRLRTQGESENIDMYVTSLLTMFARLITPMSKEEQLDRLVDNLNPTMRQKIKRSKISSVQDLVKKGREVEAVELAVKMYVPPPRPEVSLDPALACDQRKTKKSSDNAPRTVGKVNSMSKDNFKCFNCGETGHKFRQCGKTKSGKFCYVCGKKGVGKYECCRKPKEPSSGNDPRGLKSPV